MRLGIRMLNNTSTLNTLMYVNQVRVNPGESYTVLFQLVDLDQQDPYQQKAPIRYIPAPGSNITINLISINKANNILKIPSNPFSQDGSIWSFNLNTADTTSMAGVNMQVTLLENGQTRIGTAEAAIVVGPQSNYSC